MANTHTEEDEVVVCLDTGIPEPTVCYYGMCIVCNGHGKILGEAPHRDDVCGGCGGDGKSKRVSGDEHN